VNGRVRPDEERPAAVVIGLDCITGLQTARLLARRGVAVIGIASRSAHFACRSRVPIRVIVAETGGEAMIRALEELARDLDSPAVLFPCTDASVLAVSRHRAALENAYRIALPEAEVLETLLDKTRFHEFASATGLPLPRTFRLQSRSDAEAAAAALDFPCILKPAIRDARWQQNSREKVVAVSSPAELLEHFARCSAWCDILVVQEWVEGPDSELYSCNCYFSSRYRPVVTFVARKLRQWPPRAGTSCLGEECRNDAVRELALEVFQALPFHGLGYLEVKRDSRTGRHFVIEANVGRPTGRSAIAEAGGVELVYTMYCDLVGHPLPEGLEQRYEGARWIYWKQDARSAFYYWRKGEMSLFQWARSWWGRKASAVFSWRDPAPFLADIARLPRQLFDAASRGDRRPVGGSSMDADAGAPLPRGEPRAAPGVGDVRV
jgi:D-aspartate ligase